MPDSTIEGTAAKRLPLPHPVKLRGALYAMGCAITFGGITSLAKVAYDHGASPQTVVWSRILSAAVLMGCWYALSSRKRKSTAAPPPSERVSVTIPVLVVAVSVAVMSLGYLGSVYFIPVSLSVLLFFTFPFVILSLNYIIDRERVSPAQLLAFVIAFGGLALALGPSWEALDWRGVALVLVGAVGAATMIMGSERALRHISMPALGTLSNAGGAVIAGVVMVAMGAFALPETGIGWLGFAGVCGCYLVGQVLLYSATHTIGSAHTSMFLNFEPLVSMFAAVILLGEQLSGMQYVGSALVLGAMASASRSSAG